MFWGIQEVDGGEWIGTIAAHVDENNGVADLGIMIHWEFARLGYGTEAWKAASDWLLDGPPKLGKLEASCMATNIAMRRICEKTGMFSEGERKNHFLSQEGHPVSMMMYGKWPR